MMGRIRLSQKGQGMTLALIVLGAVSLLVLPFVGYASSSAMTTNRRQQRVMDQYAADAGVEHALWRFQYDPAFAASLNPSASYAQTFNGRATDITTTLASNPSPTPTPAPCPQPVTNHICLTTAVAPQIAVPGLPTTFTFTLSIRNVWSSQVNITQLGNRLPAGFSYVTGSAAEIGISTATGPLVLAAPAVTMVSGQQQLLWNFSAPQPWINAGVTATVTFTAMATLSTGTYYNSAWVKVTPNSVDLVQTGPSSPVTVNSPEFDITSTAGGVTVRARAAQTETGVRIRSWQAQ